MDIGIVAEIPSYFSTLYVLLEFALEIEISSKTYLLDLTHHTMHIASMIKMVSVHVNRNVVDTGPYV